MIRLARFAAVLGFAAVGVSAQESGAKVDFARDIQPIFEKSCYGCHGPKQQLGSLRLDSKTPAQKGFKPGHANESAIYQRVAGIGEQARMPMGAKPLEPAKIELIRRWIEQGAEWPESATVSAVAIKTHWAYVPPVKPELPPGVARPIDYFVDRQLKKEGLEPNPEADRATMLRRLSLDLIGLPPTPAELDAFLSDKDANAWQKQVDRLLSSPHYGERWARIWLDAARYADSDGYEKDKSRQVWFYRDWVIHSLNRDLPYDQFVIQQIAGDLLPKATQSQKVATGFLRNSMINEEGGIDPEQFRMEAMFDRIDAIGKGILGVTIQCAQCHNHKFDPLKQEEYYRLFAFINDSYEANIAVYTPEEEKQRQALFAGIRRVEQSMQAHTPGWRNKMAAWEQGLPQQPDWSVIRPEVDDISTGGQKYIVKEDGSLLAQGYAPTKHQVKLTAKIDAPRISAIRLELLNDPNLPLGGPGRSLKGTGALSEFTVEVAPVSHPEQVTKVRIAKATADVNLPQSPLEGMFDDRKPACRVVGPIGFAIDGNEETAWYFDQGPGRRNQPRKTVFELENPVGFEGGTLLTIHLSQKHGGWNSDDNQNNNLGRMRLSVTADEHAAADPLPATVRQIVSAGGQGRTPEQEQTIFSYWRTTVPEWAAENRKIEELWKTHPEGSTQLVLRTQDHPRETHLLTRGDFLKPGKTVTPGVPAFLHPLPPSNEPERLRFARWLVDRKSPTTARSFVNRVWQAYFGAGLVQTSEDLGKQSEPPSHPELLDWLAVDFMDSGWSIKHLHRAIVSSAAYRRSSHIGQEQYTRDPYNKWLARGPRLRVDAEIVRDIALSASGLLNPEVGGPSVYAPAPSFLFQPPVSYGPKIWNEAKDSERYRRALYTFRYRSVPYPMLQTFDAPNGDMACVRRSRSNTPLQALVTLNEPLFFEAAAALGQMAQRDGGRSDDERIRFAFRRCTGRTPEPSELTELRSFLQLQEQRLKPEAAWTALARVLLNLDETITKE